ncbi:MAG TPA: hypothetical protein VFH02_04285, partial [Jiangellaceae bacterium]|nr:hypothetical protein [Jiangellaceae bacterium]
SASKTSKSSDREGTSYLSVVQGFTGRRAASGERKAFLTGASINALRVAARDPSARLTLVGTTTFPTVASPVGTSTT